MKNLLIINIKSLVLATRSPARMIAGKAMQTLPIIENAFLQTQGDRILDFGAMTEVPQPDQQTQIVDANGQTVLPAWCDAHTHLVFAGSREQEYTDKIKGLSYEEIARRGGGILNSAKLMAEASEESLFQSALLRLKEITKWGTGAVEIKSGYGLTTDDELKMLRVIKRLKAASPLTIKATFLGAHAIPLKYKQNPNKYVDLIVEEMLPRVAEEQLADFVDVFCDKGFFSVEQTERILKVANRYGLRPKIHANELAFSGGIQAAVRHHALSVDHLEFTGPLEIETLRDSDTMPTLLPGAAFFLNMRYAPARKMMDAGLPLALASDFNPGSSPSGNMQLILAMGSILLRMLPHEVIHAATINGAYAMGVEKSLGTITPGKIANLIITKPIPSIEYLPYAYGENKVDKMILNGKLIDRSAL